MVSALHCVWAKHVDEGVVEAVKGPYLSAMHEAACALEVSS